MKVLAALEVMCVGTELNAPCNKEHIALKVLAMLEAMCVGTESSIQYIIYHKY